MHWYLVHDLLLFDDLSGHYFLSFYVFDFYFIQPGFLCIILYIALCGAKSFDSLVSHQTPKGMSWPDY